MDSALKRPGAQRLEAALAQCLPEFLIRQRWFGGKARPIASVDVFEAVPISHPRLAAWFFLARVKYTDGNSEIYSIPLVRGSEADAARLQRGEKAVPSFPALAQQSGEGTIFYDALWEKDIQTLLLQAISRQLCFAGVAGEVRASHTGALRDIWDPAEPVPEPSLMKAEQSNSSILYGRSFVLKFFRRLEEGTNPDLEIGAFLTEKAKFANVPPIAGALEYRREGREPMTIAILQDFVPNQGDAWQYTLQAVSEYYERVAAQGLEVPAEATPRPSLLSSDARLPSLARDLAGDYLESARLLGRRTAELHVALASAREDPAFTPEPFSPAYQQSLYQSMTGLTLQCLSLLRQRLGDVPASLREKAQRVLGWEEEILGYFKFLLNGAAREMRIRIHGDYHLGQVLYTSQDFVIIDFEGEPARPLSDRRLKRSPLQDVAGMLRSFHYAAYAALFHSTATRPDVLPSLEPWANEWNAAVSSAYLEAYLSIAGQRPFLSSSQKEREGLLKAYMLDKAIYELKYELNNRPEWLRIPLEGISQLVEHLRN